VAGLVGARSLVLSRVVGRSLRAIAAAIAADSLPVLECCLLNLSLRLKPLRREPQGVAIFGDSSHDIIRYTVRKLGRYLQCYGDAGADETSEMRNDFLGDARGVPARPRGIEVDCAVIAPELLGRRRGRVDR
jgi:hypothetical protein